MKIGVLIPTRGDRELLLSQAKQLLSKQTMQPDEVLIVDFKPTDDNGDITKRYRIGSENLFLEKKCDLVLFWEDDDWYSPNYIKKIFTEWVINKPDIIGIGKTIYYHLFTKQYLISYHEKRASACCTAVTKEVLNIKYPDDSYPFLDMEVWTQIHNKSVINEDNFYHVGFKHGIGKTGGHGHPMNWPKYRETDIDDSFLKSIIDEESFLFYKSLREKK